MSTNSFCTNRERCCLARARYKTVPNVFNKKSPFARPVKKPVRLCLCYRVLTNTTGMFRCYLADVKAGMTGFKVFGPLPHPCLSTLRKILCCSTITQKTTKKSVHVQGAHFTLSEVLREAKQLDRIPEKTPQWSSIHLLVPPLCFTSVSQSEKGKMNVFYFLGRDFTFCECPRAWWSCRWPSRRRWRWGRLGGTLLWRWCLSFLLCPQTSSSWCPRLWGLMAEGLWLGQRSLRVHRPWSAVAGPCCTRQNWSGPHAYPRPGEERKAHVDGRTVDLVLHCTEAN